MSRRADHATPAAATLRSSTHGVVKQIRAHSKRSIAYHVQPRQVHMGTFVSVGDWAITLHQSNITIDSAQIVLSAWPDQYHINYGIAVGDTAVLAELQDGAWLVLDVLADKPAVLFEFGPGGD